MTRPSYQSLIFDLESDGLLDRMTTIHCLAIREYETGETWRFRRNEKEDTIEDGIAMLEDCERVIGHNIMDFDLEAIKLIFPDFELRDDTIIEDTLVYVRLLFANQKDKDFDLWRNGKLPGQLIGAQTLESWGHRLHLHKGDYAKEMEALAKEQGITDSEDIIQFVWGTWNQSMDDYCFGDINVNTKLWTHCLAQRFPQGPIEFEHGTHAMAIQIGRNGFPFNIPEAQKLADEIEDEANRLADVAHEHFGWWYAPDKKKITDILWDDPDGLNADKAYDKPLTRHGEDRSRAIWAVVSAAKRTTAYTKLYKETTTKNGDVNRSLNYDRFESAPYCKVKIKDFKPTSRQMIVDRFTTVYDWEPIDFTETGQPSVDDTVLQGLVGKIPMAKELAEVFYLNKRLGQIATGSQAWLKRVEADGRIHHRLNTGGTVSGRCSHSFPNIAQVPKVKSAKVILDDGSINPILLKPNGEPMKFIFDENGGYKKNVVLKGRLGDHGWDCRNLFYVPEGWKLIGCDLSGIELRCLANVAAPFDGGFLIKEILEGDIHTTNQEAAGLSTRDQAKTFIYALIYGAGDVKIGSIVDPLASVEEQRQIGKELKAMFFKRLPGLAAAVKMIQRQAKKGRITGLDGRWLFSRAKHSAFNLRLQSDGAVIAKQWMLYGDDAFLDEGLVHGWDGDYAFLAFVHDELQVAVRDHLVDFAKEALISAAAQAGERFDFAMPVDAEAKDGMTWANTH